MTYDDGYGGSGDTLEPDGLTNVELLGGPLDGEMASLSGDVDHWPRFLTIPLNPHTRAVPGVDRVESTLPMAIQQPKFEGTYTRSVWFGATPVYIWQ